jgi:hypothetical protein
VNDDQAGSAGPPEAPHPHRLVDTANRRVAGVVYLVAAAFAVALILVIGVDLMWLTAVVPLVAIAVYHIVAGRHLQVGDMQAIEIASAEAPFEVGHASATLGFVGLTAKPVWQVLVFEAGDIPRTQALVTVDALIGTVTGSFTEAVIPV